MDAALDAIKARLRNWARWALQPTVDLGIPPPPWAAHWIPASALDAGWGDLGAPDDSRDPVYERDAMLLERAICQLPLVHRTTIKRHYIVHWRQPREELDHACRILADQL